MLSVVDLVGDPHASNTKQSWEGCDINLCFMVRVRVGILLVSTPCNTFAPLEPIKHLEPPRRLQTKQHPSVDEHQETKGVASHRCSHNGSKGPFEYPHFSDAPLDLRYLPKIQVGLQQIARACTE